ncbi:bacteriohemerythrin, partial [Magnetococcales bacterium HHB-1]
EEGMNSVETVSHESQQAMEMVTTVERSVQGTERVASEVREKMQEANQVTRLMNGSATYFGRLGSVLQSMSNALYLAQIELEIAPPPFDIRKAKAFYLSYQGELEQLAHGRLQAEALSNIEGDDNILLSWIKSQSRTQKIDQLGNMQQKLHTIAAQLISNSVSEEEAMALVAEYHTTREDLFRLMDKIYQGEQNSGVAQRSFIDWNDIPRVGVKVLDQDHKKLVDLINTLYENMRDGVEQQVMNRVLDELVNYVAGHFKREEDLFAQYGYPQQQEHIREHQKLVEGVEKLVADFQSGEFAVGIDILAFLKNWLKEHIQHTDMQYAAFFREKGVS